jgi:hypothetical protein
VAAATSSCGRTARRARIPSPFALSDAGKLARILSDGGLADVAAGELDVPLRTRSFDGWWVRTRALAGPLTQIRGGLPDEALQVLRTRLVKATRPYATSDGGLDFPGVALVASGRRD